MKKLLLTWFAITSVFSASADVPVIDFVAIAQAIIQVALTSNHVDIARQMLDQAGNPAAITDIAGALQTIYQMGQPGVGQSLPEIQISTTGQSGQSYDGNGLYTPVEPDITLPDGKILARPIEPYRKHEALQKAIADYDAVVADTGTRRESLQEAQRQTTEQLKAATTDAEVQKLKGVLASQQNELNTVAAERSEAAAKIEIQKAANEADKARQEQADDELRAASLQSALRDAMRFFNADTRPVLIPNPRKIAP